MAIIGVSFDEKLRAKAIGAWSALSGMAMAVGPVLGGFLVESVSWRAAFLINVPIAFAMLLILFRHVPEIRDPDARRLDIPGAVLAAAGLGGIVFGLIRASSAGYLLFALPGHESYWRQLFPAMVVQGFGMALVIAPLTTVALNSVEGPHSGLASGVNNAVTRVAGVLAVAVMGVFVFATFSANLDARLGAMELSPEVREAFEAEKAELGAAQAPEGVGAETAARIKEAVAESFVVGFQRIMLVSAGLALASALVAALVVGGSGSSQESHRPSIHDPELQASMVERR